MHKLKRGCNGGARRASYERPADTIFPCFPHPPEVSNASRFPDLVCIMTPEDEQCREVYAYFGVAAYFAQCFEKSLCNFLMYHNALTIGNVTQENAGEIARSIQKKTMGQLLKEIKPVVTFGDPAGEALVDEALKKRNFLLHDYFWDRAIEFMSPNGRAKMLTELMELLDLFQRADGLAKTLARAASKAAGVTDEWLKAEVDKMTRES
jgi:hypothetical protein